MADLNSILSSMDTVESLEALSQAAEAAERFDDMVKIMKALVERQLSTETALTADMRNLLSVAYKNVVGVRRSSWRMLNDDEQFDIKPEILANYKKQVESELETLCKEVLGLLNMLAEQNKDRIPKTEDEQKVTELNECQIFYLKMTGDYYRYLTEAFRTDEDYKTKCDKYYSEAMNLALDQLPATHPTRLGLALNYSVCHYEILNQPEKACALAKKAFDEAIEKLDSLNDSSYKDSTLIMQLLRDNLTIWTQSDDVEQNEGN
jgi:hypothetical protein